MKWYQRVLSGVLTAAMGLSLLSGIPTASAADRDTAVLVSSSPTQATGEIVTVIQIDYPIYTEKLNGATVTLYRGDMAIAHCSLQDNGSMTFTDGSAAAPAYPPGRTLPCQRGPARGGGPKTPLFLHLIVYETSVRLSSGRSRKPAGFFCRAPPAGPNKPPPAPGRPGRQGAAVVISWSCARGQLAGASIFSSRMSSMQMRCSWSICSSATAPIEMLSTAFSSVGQFIWKVMA